MKELLTVVTRKGQITLPAEIRRALGLKVGDRVAVSLIDAEATFGAVGPRQRPEDFKELRRLFEEGQAMEVLGETPPGRGNSA